MRGSGRSWTLNGDFASIKPTGVARYAHQTVRALDALAAEGHPALTGLDLSLMVKAGAPRVPDLKAIRIIEAADLKPRLPQAFVQIVLPSRVRGGLVSLCNFGPLALSKQVLCIHDLHPFQSPESYGRGFRAYNTVMLPRLGRRVAAVATVSAYSRGEIVRYGVAPADKVFVTYNGHEHVYAEDVGPPPSTSRPYVTAIGRDLGYKNTQMLFAIAPALADAGVDLVLAGAFDPAPHLGPDGALPPNVRLAGRVSDAELFALMRGARAFLFPSRVEGFGLPAVEAMAMDCPLVVSSAPALPEVCGDAALVVDPDDTAGWAEAAIRLAADATLRGDLIARGRARRTRFSWRTIALDYVAAMDRIDGVEGARAA